MENLDMTSLIDLSFWQSKKVLVTGHSGFKGWWLSQWLTLLGAQVYGISKEPSSEYLNRPFLLEDDIFKKILIADIGEKSRIQEFVLEVDPEIVFHLAAQPSVLEGYRVPFQTMETNFLGTANLIMILRENVPKANVIVITTDKVYRNDSSSLPFIETDELALNGDPYSASKALGDLFASNFEFPNIRNQLMGKILIARAGNVIGGGDWLPDRLIPDCIKAVYSGKNLALRSPGSTRPWQNILDVIHGYILLAQSVMNTNIPSRSAFNFGPTEYASVDSKTLCELFLKNFIDKPDIVITNPMFQEHASLSLNSSKSNEELGWRPKLDIYQSLKLTADWYQATLSGASAKTITISQINWFMLE